MVLWLLTICPLRCMYACMHECVAGLAGSGLKAAHHLPQGEQDVAAV